MRKVDVVMKGEKGEKRAVTGKRCDGGCSNERKEMREVWLEEERSEDAAEEGLEESRGRTWK